MIIERDGRRLVAIEAAGAFTKARARFEAHFLAAALDAANGNATAAAEAVGMPYATFRAKLAALGVKRRVSAVVEP